MIFTVLKLNVDLYKLLFAFIKEVLLEPETCGDVPQVPSVTSSSAAVG